MPTLYRLSNITMLGLAIALALALVIIGGIYMWDRSQRQRWRGRV